jgi:anhydro-N-acetylmuramic acid kinase
MQLGEPSVIAARTGIVTVAHLRGADMAAGGQGAPLVPAFHHRVFGDAAENRAILNLGGIANLTLLPASSGNDSADQVLGFDTGPGNALLDTWATEHLGEPQDTDGRWAGTGRVHEALLNLMLQDSYFQKAPPKSTGREYFHLAWLRGQITSLTQPPNPADVQRTLCELTALSVVTALDEYGPGDERILLCGGGARNPMLRERLTDLLSPRRIADTGDYGIPGDWVEAASFAWLAMRTLNGQPGNLPSVTGAREAVVLGGIYAPFGARNS